MLVEHPSDEPAEPQAPERGTVVPMPTVNGGSRRATAVSKVEAIDPWKELEAARVFKKEALAEIERLRGDVAALDSWLRDATGWMKVEHVQQQRLRQMRAAERDRRWSFVLSFPLMLTLFYGAGIVILVAALVLGHL